MAMVLLARRAFCLMWFIRIKKLSLPPILITWIIMDLLERQFWLLTRLLDLVQKGARLRMTRILRFVLVVLIVSFRIKTVLIWSASSVLAQFKKAAERTRLVRVLKSFRMARLTALRVLPECRCRLLTVALNLVVLMARFRLLVTLRASLRGKLQALQSMKVLRLETRPVPEVVLCPRTLVSSPLFCLRALRKWVLLWPSLVPTAVL